jgi:hypothetical protein
MDRPVGAWVSGQPVIRNFSKLQPWTLQTAACPAPGAEKNGKREFNSPIFPVSLGNSKIIALRLGPANRAWGDMRDTGG